MSAAIRSVLITSAVTAAGIPGYAMAQTQVEEVVVTGSLIPRDLNAPGVPVTVLTAEQIATSGVTTDVLEVLKKTEPYFFGGLNIGSENGNIASGSTNGGSQVALRNRSTLVLINGRRAAISPVAASGGFNFVDISMIPVSAVERIEILADGASATYGADAVGGVVNVILKSDYEGFGFGARYGSDDNGYEQKNYYASMGTRNDTTSITFSVNYQESDPLLQIERPWGCCQFRSPSFAGSVNIGTNFYYLNPTLNAPPPNLDLTPAQLTAQGIYSAPLTQAGVAQFFDLSQKPTMLIESERKSAVLSFKHDLSDSHTVFSDVMVTQSDTWSQLNAQPVSALVLAANPNNPFNVNVTARNRFIDFPRTYYTDTTGWRGVIGVRGDIAGTWKYEVAANLNYTKAYFENNGLIEAAALLAATNTLAYNPFARVQTPGVIESFVGSAFENYESSLYSYDARAFGELFDLPAGPVQLAVGVATARDKLTYVNDRLSQTGGWLQATPTLPFGAAQKYDSVYSEVRVPVFSEENAITGFHGLEFSLAARYQDYESISESPTVPKFTMRWQPTEANFFIRGSYSESFTAPTLYELFGPTGAGFTSSQNIPRYSTAGVPLGTIAGPSQMRQRTGSNVNLEPSTSDNYTLGFEWAPEGAMQGFTASIDYYNISEKDIVSSLPASDVLANVEQFGPASPFATFIRLGQSTAGQLLFDTGAPITTPGQITNRPSDEVWLSLNQINIAGIDQDGLDINLGYSWDTATAGTFSARLNTVYMMSYDQELVPGLLPIDDLVNAYHDDYGLFPEYKAFMQFGWSKGAWSAGINTTYLPSMDDVTFGAPFGKIDSYNSWDLLFGYDFSDMGPALKVTLGVNNVTDEDPPFIESEGNQSRDIASYDPLGRFYVLTTSYKF